MIIEGGAGGVENGSPSPRPVAMGLVDYFYLEKAIA
jgi:hypothetical protein